MAIRQFGADDYVIRSESEEALLVAYRDQAVYGLELAFPESDDDPYRLDLLRTTRDLHGAELTQRLTLVEYNSHMEAEEGLKNTSESLYEQGREAIAPYLPQLETQPVEYTAGFLVASYPPDAVFTGELASVSVIALQENGLTIAPIAEDLPPHEASHLSLALEDAQAIGGIGLLLETATQAARLHDQLTADQALFKPLASSPTFYLDQREVLDQEAEIIQPAIIHETWGWQDSRFAVLPPVAPGQAHQTALLDVYRDALTSDLAGSYLPLGEHQTLAEAETQRDHLEASADSAEAAWRQFAAQQTDHPQWQPMQPEHYAIYEHLAERSPSSDILADPQSDPLLAEATRLGAVIVHFDHEEKSMKNTNWEVELNEHVTYLPPYVTAEYATPANAEGADTPVRIRLQNDPSIYGFEVSAPDEQGVVTLAATKTFEQENEEVTTAAVLKTYHPHDREGEEADFALSPHQAAVADARALVYEWGRRDLDHALGSAFKLAQAHGFQGETLFEEGPPDTFTPAADARDIVAIHAERDSERDAEIAGSYGRLTSPIGAYVDRYAGDYVPVASADILRVTGTPPIPLPLGEIRYSVLPLDALPAEPDDPSHPADYDPVRMKPAVDGLPANYPADYAFEVQHIRAFGAGDTLIDSYHLVEAVKTWRDPSVIHDPGTRLTLSLPLVAYDEQEDAFQMAHHLTAKWGTEGIQPAMQEAAVMAEAHVLPDLMDMDNGHLFGLGPEDPFTVEFTAREREATPTPSPEPPVYSRMIGDAAYDFPLEDGQAYEFRARPLPEFGSEAALAVEAVKHWRNGNIPQQEVVTLSIFHDPAEARQDVDTYVALAEYEGIQSAMSRAALVADVQNYPDLVERADELGIHSHDKIRFGNMFKHGPADPFLSEREINHAVNQDAADHPMQHNLSLEVVTVQDNLGNPLGHAVVALDAQWDHEETSRDLEDAREVTAYELAQFERQPEVDVYAASLNDYLTQRGLPTEGANLTPSLDFLKTVQSMNGLGGKDHPLDPVAMSLVTKGEWSIQHLPENFHPMSLENIALESPADLPMPDMDL